METKKPLPADVGGVYYGRDAGKPGLPGILMKMLLLKDGTWYIERIYRAGE